MVRSDRIIAAAAYLYFVVGTVVLVFVTGPNRFIRPTDDAKELFLYAWLAVLALLIFCTPILKKLPLQKSNDAQMTLRISVVIYLAYIFIHPFMTGAPVAEGVVTWGQCVLWFLGIACISRFPSKYIKTQIVALAMVSLICAVLGRWIYPNPRTVWPIGHISYFADFLLIGFILWSGLCWIVRQWGLKLLIGAAAVNCLVVLIWASTRTPIVALLFLFGVLVLAKAIQSYRRQPQIGVLLRPLGIGVGLVVGLGILLYYFPFHLREQPLMARFAQLITDLQNHDAAGASNRVNIWKATTQMALAHPVLGWGFGNFRFAYTPFAPGVADIFDINHWWVMHPHNELLNQLVSGGIVGLLLWLNMIVRFFRVAWRVLCSASMEQDKRWAILAMSATVAVIMTWQFDTSYEHPLFRFCVVPLIALILNLDMSVIRLKRAPVYVQLSRWRPWLAGMIVLVAAWLACGSEISGALILSAEKDSLHGVRSANVEFVLKYFPNSQEILNRVGGIKVRLNEMYQAKAFFERSLKIYPGVPQTYQNLILIHKNLGESSEAALLSEQYKKIFPRAPAF